MIIIMILLKDYFSKERKMTINLKYIGKEQRMVQVCCVLLWKRTNEK